MGIIVINPFNKDPYEPTRISMERIRVSFLAEISTCHRWLQRQFTFQGSNMKKIGQKHIILVFFSDLIDLCIYVYIYIYVFSSLEDGLNQHGRSFTGLGHEP